VGEDFHDKKLLNPSQPPLPTGRQALQGRRKIFPPPLSKVGEGDLGNSMMRRRYYVYD
jgi:hypothetical protein